VTDGAATGGVASGGGDVTAVWLLAVGQTLTYAALYYAFAALLPDLEVATGWSKAQLAAGPTVAFLITAVLTPFTGRLVDRGWGGELLIWMPALGAAALAGLSLVQTPFAWVGLWAVIGVAQAGSFYETCFAFLTRRLGDGARAAITRITLVAGFASTLSFPLGHALGRAFGGQGALVAFAGLILLGSVPVNMIGVARLRRLQGVNVVRPAPEPGALAAALRKPAFWALAAIFGLTYITHSVLITYALVLFADRGAPEAMAVLAASCIGPAQVAGRFALLMNESRVGNARATICLLGSIVLACGLLWLAGIEPALIFGFALLQGVGIGLSSILRPVLLAELLGRRGFGAISGAAAVAPILGTATGPVFGAMLLANGGFGAVYAACLMMSFTALGLGFWLLRGRV
jgi:predicted MFS family arabinose efflux permease